MRSPSSLLLFVLLSLVGGEGPSQAVTPLSLISVSPASIDFGEVAVGDSATQSVTITNVGGEVLAIGTIATALPSDAFAVVNDGCSGQQIGPDTSCLFEVRFAPVTAGAESADVEIPSNDPDTPVFSLPVTGTGLPVPVISVAPTTLDFGEVLIGNEASLGLTVTNDGEADLTIGQLDISGTDLGQFSLQNDDCSGQLLLPAGTCLVTVAFHPDSRGAKAAQLVIPSEAVNDPSLEVPLSGEGIGQPDIEVSPPSLDFGTVAIGGSSDPQTVTVTNLGTADLLLGEIIVIGRDGDQFVIDSDTCSGETLAFEETCSIALVFFPTTPGEKEGILRIPSNDPADDLLDIPMTGIAERSCGATLLENTTHDTRILWLLVPLLLLQRRRSVG